MIGENATTCVVVVKDGDRLQAVCAFKVQQPGNGKNRPINWRSPQAKAGEMIDSAGKADGSGGKVEPGSVQNDGC